MPSYFDNPTGLRQASVFDNPAPGMTPEQAEAEAAARAGQNSGVFQQGLSRGMRGLKSSAAALYGTGAETTGSPDAANEAYDYARHQQEMSQLESPGMKTWADTHSPADLARFAVGGAGSALPYVAPAVIAPAVARGLGAGAAGRYAAGMGANVIPMAGQSAERMHDDPVSAALPAGQRLGTALSEGAAGAAMYEAVPHIMGERAVGAPGFAAKGSINPLTTAAHIAGDTALTSAGMGAAGGATELLGEGVQSSLNPNRDTSQDSNNLAESVAGGAAGMAPFALPHAVMAHTVGAARAPVTDAAGNVMKAAGSAATDAMSRTPGMPSLDEAGKAIGKAASDLKGFVAGKLAGGDADTLTKTPATDGSIEGLQQDDATRNTAASNLAQKYAADASAPDYLKQASTDFLTGNKTGNAWEPMQAAVSKYNGESAFGNAVDSLKSGLSALGAGVKKVAGDTKENAQLPHDPFDDLLGKTLLEHANTDNTGDNTTSLIKIAQSLPALKTWVANGFSGTKGGEVRVPSGIDAAFKDPVAAVQSAHDLMKRQGLLSDDSDAKLKEVTKELKDRANAKKDGGTLVEDNLLPTAQDKYQFSGADHTEIATRIKAMVEDGKTEGKGAKPIDEATLDELFGHNKQAVLDAIEKNAKLDRGEHQQDEKSVAGADEHNTDDTEAASRSDEIGSMTDEMHPNEVKADVGWHGPYDKENAGAAAGHKNKMGELRTLGKATRDVGVIDHLREVHKDNPDHFMKSITGLLHDNADKIPAGHSSHPDKYLNDRYRLVRSEDASDKREPIDVKGSEFDNLSGHGGDNKWGMAAGEKNKYGGPENGRLWFERAPGMTKEHVDRATGEITPPKPTKAMQFNTSAARIISRMGLAMKDTGGARRDGVLDRHDMLLQGISSMLASKNEDGSNALTGRVGIMRDGKVEWLGKNGKLPDDFKLSDGSTAKDVPRAQERAYNNELRKQMIEWQQRATERGTKEGEVEQVREALRDKDMAKLTQLRDKFVQDNWGESESPKKSATVKETKITGKSVDKETGIEQHATKTETKLLSEGEEMAAAADAKESATPRRFDESTGEEIQPRATRGELAATRDKLAAAKLAREEGDGEFAADRQREKDQEGEAMLQKENAETPGATSEQDRQVHLLQDARNISRTEAVQEYMKGSRVKEPLTLKEAGKQAYRQSEVKPDVKPNATPDELIAAVHKLVGKDVAVEIAKALVGKSGAAISGDWQKGVIRIAMNAHDPMGVAFHESMHELMQRMTDEGRGKSLDVLQQMADSPSVVRQMEIAFAGDKAVLAAIKGDPAERAAYAFQLWAAGKLRVGPASETVFHKIANMIRKVLGLLSNDQKAVRIMEQFAAGKMSDRGAMAKVLNTEEARGEYARKVGKLVSPILSKGGEYVGFAENALTGTDNTHLDWIGRQLHNKTGGQGDGQGYLSAKEQMHAKFDNKFADVLQGKSKEEIDATLEGLQKKEWHADPAINKMQHDIANVFKEMYAYGSEAGLSRLDQESGKWVKMGKRDDYRLPVSWDASKLVVHADEFKDDMRKYHSDALQSIADEANKEVARGEHAGQYTASWEKLNNKNAAPVTADDVLNAIHNRMIRTGGQVDIKESQNELGFTPNMKAINKRTLHWIDQSKFAKYQEKDMAKILTTYVAQMTSRTEYARRFGADGEIMQQKMEAAYKLETDRLVDAAPGDMKPTGKALEALQVEALKKLAPAQRAIMAQEGTLGHDISPTLRAVNAYSIVYQNLRLLGYPLFSSIIDPLGIMVNGGEMKDAYATLKRGFTDVAKEWGKLTGLREDKPEVKDEATRVAEMIGTIDSGMFMSTLGNTYGSQFLGATARGINDKFFKWNGMEPFTRAMRVGATQAGISFIKRHYEAPNEHSDRYFKELGLDKKEVQIDKDGRLNVDNPAVQQAVMRWVDGAILRPNAAIRPTMSSDPHYATFYHLKQFMYATHAVITKRMMTEMKHGNMNPTMLAFAGYIPTMLAADAVKGILQGAMGGMTPVWEHQGVGGVIGHGLQRTGLTGPAQMGIDVPEYGPASILGPTAEQISSAATHPLGETIRGALAIGPLNFSMAGNAAND